MKTIIYLIFLSVKHNHAPKQIKNVVKLINDNLIKSWKIVGHLTKSDNFQFGLVFIKKIIRPNFFKNRNWFKPTGFGSVF